MFVGYKLLLKSIQNNHSYEQELSFYKIQRETDNLLNKLLHKYSFEKEILLKKHQEVLAYLETKNHDIKLDEIYEKINQDLPTKPYNIYITDENLIIKNTTFKPDLGFNLSFAKHLFDEHKKQKIIGVSSPIFETYSMNFLSFTDSYLPKNLNKILQVSYTYPNIANELKKVQSLIDTNPNIKNSTAYIVFKDGYIGDFIFKSFKAFKPSLDEVNKRINMGKNLSDKIKDDEYITTFFKENNQYFRISYFSQKSAIYNDAKVIYSVIFDETKHHKEIFNLNIIVVLLSFFGVFTIFILYKIRYKEKLLKYKDKFIEHSVHEIKTPLSIISLNSQLRKRTLGEDKYSKKIEGALKTLENSYEDMSFLHTRNHIEYNIENLNLAEILRDRVKYFEIIATTQNRKLKLEISNNLHINISKIEITRLIDNNLSNMIKYSDIGSCLKIILNNNILEFHSQGKPIKNIKTIFTRYTRENDSVGGHGLGLSIVKDICTKYNITINVETLNNCVNIFSYKFI